MRVSEILHKSADILESREWTRGNGWEWQIEGAPVCLEGGIAAAMGTRLVEFERSYGRAMFSQTRYNGFHSCPAYQAVLEYLGDRVPVHSVDKGPHLYSFNDRVAQSKEEVVEVLRAAAEVEAAKEAAELRVAEVSA